MRPVTPKAEAKGASPRRPADEDDTSGTAVWYVIGAIVAVLLLGAGLVLWLRRGDRHVRGRLNELRQGQFQLPDEGPEPPGAAGPPPVSQ